jgi:antitoxin (DNA-binding transcriptional repressor) of toxin-antitoxin stability system
MVWPRIRYTRRLNMWTRLVHDPPPVPGNTNEELVFLSETHVGYARVAAGESITATDWGENVEEMLAKAPPWPRNRRERRAMAKLTPMALQRAKRRLGPVKDPYEWNARFWVHFLRGSP